VGWRNLLPVLLAAACSKEAAHRARETDTGATPSTPSLPSTAPDLSGAHHVGTRHGPLPEGITEQGGALIRIGTADYAIAHLKSRDGDLLWLDSIVRGKTQPPEKIVRAELRIPPLERDERLFMASCDVNGRLDARVVAIVVNEPGATKFTKIRQAWRADARRGRFDVIPVTGVTCEEPGPP
jgi:hypothetical protein